MSLKYYYYKVQSCAKACWNKYIFNNVLNVTTESAFLTACGVGHSNESAQPRRTNESNRVPSDIYGPSVDLVRPIEIIWLTCRVSRAMTSMWGRDGAHRDKQERVVSAGVRAASVDGTEQVYRQPV